MVISLLTLSFANAATMDGSNASRSTQLFKSKDVQPKRNLIARAHNVESFDSTLKIRQLTPRATNSRSLSFLSGIVKFVVIMGIIIAGLGGLTYYFGKGEWISGVWGEVSKWWNGPEENVKDPVKQGEQVKKENVSPSTVEGEGEGTVENEGTVEGAAKSTEPVPSTVLTEKKVEADQKKKTNSPPTKK